MITINYEFGGREVDTGENGLELFDTETFSYEPESKELVSALKEIIDVDDLTDDDLDNYIDENIDELVDEYEDYLKDHFEEEAYEEYTDQKAYTKNPNAYYGVNRNE